jgi:hypothetical protein
MLSGGRRLRDADEIADRLQGFDLFGRERATQFPLEREDDTDMGEAVPTGHLGRGRRRRQSDLVIVQNIADDRGYQIESVCVCHVNPVSRCENLVALSVKRRDVSIKKRWEMREGERVNPTAALNRPMFRRMSNIAPQAPRDPLFRWN